MKESDIEQWIHQLMDGKLTPDERTEIEKRLKSTEEGRSILERELQLRKLLQEAGRETPIQDQPDFMWSRVREGILTGDQVSQTRRPLIPWARLAWLLAPAILILSLFLWYPSQKNPSSRFGEIRDLESLSSNLHATSYESAEGNATILWVSGWPETRDTQYGEIWQVYSFRPDVSATAYRSDKGNATVIWISGMDDEGSRSAATL